MRQGCAGAALLPLVLLLGGCANSWLLLPKYGEVDAHGAVRETVALKDGGHLEVWTARNSERPLAFVLEFTGNATRAESVATASLSRWAGHPVEVWVMNYPGYGGSSGLPRLGSIAPAALAAYDALAARAHGRAIYLAGNSMGSAVALYVATRRRCWGMVLENPPPLRELLIQNYGWWNLWLVMGPAAAEVPDELEAMETAPKVRVPAVFLCGTKDKLVPPKYHDMVIAAYGGRKRVIEAPTGHNVYLTAARAPGTPRAVAWLWGGGR